MIATVQNTGKTVIVNGKKAVVWEGFSQKGIRFHLFVIGDAILEKTPSESVKTTYRGEMADVKLTPAGETTALPAEIAI